MFQLCVLNWLKVYGSDGQTLTIWSQDTGRFTTRWLNRCKLHCAAKEMTKRAPWCSVICHQFSRFYNITCHPIFFILNQFRKFNITDISRPCIIIMDIISNIAIVVVDNFAVAIVITISCSFVFTKHWKLLFVKIRRFKPILIWSRTSQIRTFELFQYYQLCTFTRMGLSRDVEKIW